MNITFYARKSGLGNNGGSRTILKSMEVLRGLGHNVDIVADCDKFTWFDHRKPVNRVSKYTNIVVAVSALDVASMHQECKNIKKAWWIRGWERWQMSERELMKRFTMGQMNICNSNWLRVRLSQLGIRSKTVFSGLDIDDWYDMNLRSNDKVAIGCLYNRIHRTKRWDMFCRLIRTLGCNDYRYYTFGAKTFKSKRVRCYTNPSLQSLRKLYSKCHIWFAPTELEGFHNVPAEAALCGCLILSSRVESNGMSDYCSQGSCMSYNTMDEAIQCIKNPDYSKISVMQNLLKTQIGSRKTNMERMVKVLSC